MYFKLHFKSQFKYMTSLYRHQNLLRSYNYMKYFTYFITARIISYLKTYWATHPLNNWAQLSTVQLNSWALIFFLGWPAKVSSQKFPCWPHALPRPTDEHWRAGGYSLPETIAAIDFSKDLCGMRRKCHPRTSTKIIIKGFIVHVCM